MNADWRLPNYGMRPMGSGLFAGYMLYNLAFSSTSGAENIRQRPTAKSYWYVRDSWHSLLASYRKWSARGVVDDISHCPSWT